MLGNDEEIRGQPVERLLIKDQSPTKTDTSISFLELPWAASTESAHEIEAQEESMPEAVQTMRHFPAFVDPLFADFYVEVPELLRGLMDGVVERGFVYCLGRSLHLAIHRCREERTMFKAAVVDFSREEFVDGFDTAVVVVLGRNKHRNTQRTERDREYKTAVMNRVRYEKGEDGHRRRMQALHALQVREGTNFVFIETPEELSRALRSIVSFLVSENTYVPKTRTYTGEQGRVFLAGILENIPGISKSVAGSLASRFGNLRSLCKALEADTAGELAGLEIASGGHIRELGRKQLEKLKAALLSNEEELLL
jgi:hypothetical protein